MMKPDDRADETEEDQGVGDVADANDAIGQPQAERAREVGPARGIGALELREVVAGPAADIGRARLHRVEGGAMAPDPRAAETQAIKEDQHDQQQQLAQAAVDHAVEPALQIGRPHQCDGHDIDQQISGEQKVAMLQAPASPVWRRHTAERHRRGHFTILRRWSRSRSRGARPTGPADGDIASYRRFDSLVRERPPAPSALVAPGQRGTFRAVETHDLPSGSVHAPSGWAMSREMASHVTSPRADRPTW